MEQSWVLLDPNTGLHVAWYFWLRVLDEVNRATRYGVPFGLLLLEVSADGSKPGRLADEGLSYVPAAIRSTDLAGVLAPGRAAVLLPHQDTEAASIAKARILERIARACPESIRWEATLLCFPEHAAEVSNLLTTGWTERDHAAPGLEETA